MLTGLGLLTREGTFAERGDVARAQQGRSAVRLVAIDNTAKAQDCNYVTLALNTSTSGSGRDGARECRDRGYTRSYVSTFLTR